MTHFFVRSSVPLKVTKGSVTNQTEPLEFLKFLEYRSLCVYSAYYYTQIVYIQLHW